MFGRGDLNRYFGMIQKPHDILIRLDIRVVIDLSVRGDITGGGW